MGYTANGIQYRIKKTKKRYLVSLIFKLEARQNRDKGAVIFRPSFKVIVLSWFDNDFEMESKYRFIFFFVLSLSLCLVSNFNLLAGYGF